MRGAAPVRVLKLHIQYVHAVVARLQARACKRPCTHVSARLPGCVRFKDSRPRASHVAPVLGKTAQQQVERRSLSAWGCHPQRVIDDTPWPLRRGHEQIATTGYCCTHPQATGHILFIVLLIIITRSPRPRFFHIHLPTAPQPSMFIYNVHAPHKTFALAAKGE